MGGAPPAEAHRAAEAAARERDNRTPLSNNSSKRHREWDDADPTIKRQTNDETRARLDDPHSRFRASPAPGSHGKPAIDGERPQYAAVHSGPNSANGGSNIGSPTAARRIDEEKRRPEEYKPSEAAHHPPNMHNLMHNDADVRNQGSSLPPINTGPPSSSAPNTATSNGPQSGGHPPPGGAGSQTDTPSRPEETKREERSPEQPKDQDGDTRMREEQPMRKIEEENYDDDEEPGAKVAVDAKAASAGARSGDASPREKLQEAEEAKLSMKRKSFLKGTTDAEMSDA